MLPAGGNDDGLIEAIAGEDFNHTVDEAIAFIQDGIHEYWMFVGDRSVWLEVATGPDGVKYLRTQNDSFPPSSLLSLPESG